jgi:Protein of unknown function (DUF4242)
MRTVERMEGQAAAEARHTYLVEHYRPGFPAEGLRDWASRVREAVERLEGEGKPVRYVRSTIVPADESFLSIVEAASEDLVRDAYRQAGIPFERISCVIPEES